jgi:hypothetical protein
MRLLLILSICLATCGLPTPASAALSPLPPGLAAGDLVAYAASFRLQGTNGYQIQFGGFSERLDGRGEIYVGVVRNRQAGAAYYSAPGIVSESSVKADLGPFGRVDLALNPSGRRRKIHIACSRQNYTFEPATYEGIVEFKGEGGFTAAHATQAPLMPLSSFCIAGGGYGESRGGGEPGARLGGISFEHGRKLTFQVNKNHPRGRVKYSAEIRERRQGISIFRTVEGFAGAGAFQFADDLRAASLDPPLPFSGSASLARGPNSVLPAWRGDLALDFPGRSGVPLAGSGVHVNIVHACFSISGDPSFAATC